MAKNDIPKPLLKEKAGEREIDDVDFEDLLYYTFEKIKRKPVRGIRKND